MFAKSKVTQSMIDAVSKILAEEKKELLLEPDSMKLVFIKLHMRLRKPIKLILSSRVKSILLLQSHIKKPSKWMKLLPKKYKLKLV
jgi:hypothetical protein